MPDMVWVLYVRVIYMGTRATYLGRTMAMVKMTKEVLDGIIRDAYGLEIPDERLTAISRIVTQTLEALEKSSAVELEGLEPTS